MVYEFVPEEEYKKIVEHIPIPTIDLVILKDNKILLVYRNNQPCKNQWFFPGGRIAKNEKLEDAVIRQARDELGMDIKIERIIGVYDFIVNETPFEGIKTGFHTIPVAFLVSPISDKEIELDKDHSNFKWFDKIEDHFHPYMKQVLKDSNVFG